MKGMFKLLFSNADEELEKLKVIKQEIEEINTLELDKMFVGVEDIQRVFPQHNQEKNKTRRVGRLSVCRQL